MKMVYEQYVLGGVIATLLGFALFIYNSRGKKKNIDPSMKIEGSECFKSAENRICQSDSDENTHMIIVGAGVAGSALAYALGKVFSH